MKNQFFAYFSLTVQRLFKCANGKIARHAAIRYACNHTAIVEVQNCTVIADIASCEKQISEVGQPYLMDPFGGKISPEQVLKVRMLCPAVVFGWFSLHDGTQPEFLVHVLMNCPGRKIYTCARQIGSHSAIAVNTIMFIVDHQNLIENLLLFRLPLCPPTFSVVVISVRINVQPSQQPPNTKQLAVLVDAPICLSSIPFAKNAAAFFRKRFSFRASASSSRRRRFSFISSRSFWALELFKVFCWHFSHHLQMLAFEIPYSAVRLR